MLRFMLLYLHLGIEGVPRTVGIIQPILLFCLISMSRFIAVYWLGNMYLQQLSLNKKPKTLIYGTSNEGRKLATSLLQNADLNVVGFDDDEILHDNQINGLPIYNPSDLDKLLNKLNISEIILTYPHNNRHRHREIIKKFQGRNQHFVHYQATKISF